MANGQVVEVSFIEDEEFDFDFPVSPGSPHSRDSECEDEDEVFFGPVGYKEKCVAVNTETVAVQQQEENVKPLSPLNSEQVVELFKEATAVAVMLRNSNAESPQVDNQKGIENIRRRIIEMQLNVENCNPSESKKSDTGENDSVVFGKAAPNFDIKNEKKHLVRSEFNLKTNSRNILKEKIVKTDCQMTKLTTNATLKPRKTGIQKPSSRKESRLPQTQTPSKSFFSSPVNKKSIYGLVNSPANSSLTKNLDSKPDAVTGSPRKHGKRNKLERPILYSRQSSGASDTSISENKEIKVSKLLAPGQSGLLLPGSFAVRRRRTSSSSSVSSTSSTSSLPANLNETFIISRGSSGSSGAPAVRSTSASNSKGSATFVKPRALITKSNLKPIGFTKPAFARHNETDKNKLKSKLQPMKALQRPRTENAIATDSVRSQACATPKKSEPRMSGGTPRQGTPVRRRSNLVSAASSLGTPSKKVNSGLVVTSANVRPRGSSDTLVKRRESGVSPGGIKPQGEVHGPTGMPVKRRANAALSCQTTQNNVKDTGPSTPDGTSTMAQAEVCKVTPQANAAVILMRKSQSASCKKRRSFLPTPTRSGHSQTRNKSVSSFQRLAHSPVPFQISPEPQLKPKVPCDSVAAKEMSQNPSELSDSLAVETQANEKACEKEASTTSSPAPSESSEPGIQTTTDSSAAAATQLESDAPVSQEVEFAEEVAQTEARPMLCEVTPGGARSNLITSHVSASESPLLMMLSPLEKPDPFSPGNISPNLPQNATMPGCPTLVPTVLSAPVNDLMLHTTPVTKAEVNLIELRDSPMVDVLSKCNTKKLVDI